MELKIYIITITKIVLIFRFEMITVLVQRELTSSTGSSGSIIAAGASMAAGSGGGIDSLVFAASFLSKSLTTYTNVNYMVGKYALIVYNQQ